MKRSDAPNGERPSVAPHVIYEALPDKPNGERPVIDVIGEDCFVDQSIKFPRLYKVAVQSFKVHTSVEPGDYLSACAELLFLTIVGSYCITWLHDKITGDDILTNNPIRNMIGYNNPCAFWDSPPALYFASLMFCPMVYLGLRYATQDSLRARMTTGVHSKARYCQCINVIYACSQIIMMGIFIIRPIRLPSGSVAPDASAVDDMHFHMRLHSACFLQFVPILMITMVANYVEGFMSGHPKMQPSAAAWCVLAFYMCATIMETGCATYAIMFYEGNYQQIDKDGTMQPQSEYFKVDETFMMVVDYCWFVSLPLVGAFKPIAPDLIYRVRLEDSFRDYEVGNGEAPWKDDRIVEAKRCVGAFWRMAATLLLIQVFMVPLMCLVLYCIDPQTQHRPIISAIGLGFPLFAFCIFSIPIMCETDADSSYSSWCCCGLSGFTLNNARFVFSNYTKILADFAKAAVKPFPEFRQTYGKWFVDQCEDDEQVGVKFGGNTRMIYGWEACKERLESLGDRIEADEVKRESELALAVMNNLMWPEAGKFALGYSKEAHAFVRPYIASVFDCGEGVTWDYDILRTAFRELFNKVHVLDHNLMSRNVIDIINPAASKTIVTQMCLKVLHKVVFDVWISDDDAIELAALQTTQLIPAALPSAVTRTFLVWTMIAGPARDKAMKWIGRYKQLLPTKWPQLESFRIGSSTSFDLLASAFLDTFLQAGGRSVPLAIDLTLGYILSANKPACIVNMDFTEPDNIRKLMMECMRYHPPVTVIPTWVPGVNEEWEHELICLDRALADPTVFPDPDKFKVERPENKTCSMAWGDCAHVNGKKDHPHSHGCPGKELSINMVVAFVMEYWNAGPWDVENTNIEFNYYGTKGFKCIKNKQEQAYYSP